MRAKSIGVREVQGDEESVKSLRTKSLTKSHITEQLDSRVEYLDSINQSRISKMSHTSTYRQSRKDMAFPRTS